MPGTLVSPAALASMGRVAAVAADGALSRAARAAGVLEELRALVPFVGAELSPWDPIREEHRVLANAGYDQAVVSWLNGPVMAEESRRIGVLESGRATRMRDVPGDPLTLRTISELLLPAGYCEGLSIFLRGEDGRLVGALHLSVDDGSQPTDEARALIDALAPTLAQVVDVTRSASEVARLVAPDAAAVAVAEDGSAIVLPGHPRAEPLDPPSPLLAAALDGLRRGRERFLWEDEHGGWLRVHALPCREDGSDLAAVVTARRDVDAPYGLTRREVEVLTLLVEGGSNPAIARALWLSPRTVGSHVERILEKLAAPTRAAAAAHATREGLLLPRLAPHP